MLSYIITNIEVKIKNFTIIILNNGSVDGDPAAAMRYTESRLAPAGELLMTDIEKNTVDMQLNYDETEYEAKVLPGLWPGILCGATNGIAVGLACSFLPHLAKDVYAAIDKLIENILNGTDTTDEELIKIIKAPDFPTGGIITNPEEIEKAYISGQGNIKIRSVYEIDEKSNSIIITEIPYNVNKSNMVDKINERKEEIEGIKEARDESDRDGLRVVIELKRGANTDLIISRLCKYTDFASSVSINHNALVNGKIQTKLSLKNLIEYFVLHAMDVIKRKSQYDFDKKKKRLHIVEGFLKISSSILECIKLITESKTDDDIFHKLKEEYSLDEEQIQAIISRQVRSLKKISEEEFITEADNLRTDILHLTSVIEDEFSLLEETREELKIQAEKFKNEKRRTKIGRGINSDIDEKSITTKEDIALIHTHKGMIKTMKISEYNASNRGAKGVSIPVDEDDFITELLTLTTHDMLVFITNTGKAIMLPAYKLPLTSRTAKCKYTHNYVNYDPNEEKIISIIAVNEEDLTSDNKYIIFTSRAGIIKKLSYANLPSRINNGALAVKIRDGDEIVSCIAADEEDYILLATREGFALRFKSNNVRAQGRTGSGVTGIKFKTNTDYVIGAMVANDDDNILVLTENGIGKRTQADAFTIHNRGGSGMSYHKANKKTGAVINVLRISNDSTLITITKDGMIIRTNTDTIGIKGRNSPGIKIITLKDDDQVILASAAPKTSDEENVEEENNG